MSLQKDLLKTASYFNEHNYLSYELQLNGIRWDDEEATKLDFIYTDLAIEVLKKLLLLPHVINILNISTQDIINIQATTDINVLKSIFNPEASDKNARAKFESILITKRLKMCLMLNKLKSEILSNSENSDYPNLSMMLQLIAETSSEESNPIIKRNSKLEVLDTIRDSIPSLYKDNIFTNSELNLISKYSNYVLEGTSHEILHELFISIITYMGVDIDNSKTYTQEAETILYYRLFKKIQKAKNTYIWGTPGRSSVKVVSRLDMQNSRLVRRLSPYKENIDISEDYLFCPEFRANTAITKRWTSTAHVIPANSEIRNIQKSRYYEDGVLIHFDYSQIEIRVLALLCQDEGLLQAYKDGKDIHKYVASKIWNKNENEVTDQERKFAKLASFGAIYGQSYQAFADSFMNGNLAAATDFFERFFGMFPRIDEWRKARHEEVLTKGEVTTLWGDTIIIPFDRSQEYSIAEAKRQSGNYPVQNGASQIAGVSIARISRFIQDNNYIAKPYCFTHDAGDIDTHIKHAIPVCYQIPIIAEDQAQKEWNFPAKIDFEIGTAGNRLVSFVGNNNTRPIVLNKDGSYSIDAKIEGEESSITALVSSLNRICKDINITITDQEEYYTSFSELFLVKRSYSREIGSTIIKKSGILTGTFINE